MTEKTPTSVAPAAVHAVAPRMAGYTDTVLFGDVWLRPGLAPRDRSLVTIAALIAAGRAPQVGSHVQRGLDNGLAPREISEIVTHLAFYSGWPNAVSAAAEIQPVFATRGIEPAMVAASDAPLLVLDPEAEAKRHASVQAGAGAVSPPLADYTNDVLFADLWRRTELAHRDRSLVTIAALIALGQSEQLPFHVNRAMDNGLSQDELAEVLAHLAFYAGWPRAMSAVAVVRTILEARG